MPPRRRVVLALLGLADLCGGLWFGAGTAVLVLFLVVLFTGSGDRPLGVPERVLLAILVLAFIAGFGAGTTCFLWAGALALLGAWRGWTPHSPPTGPAQPDPAGQGDAAAWPGD